MLISEFAEQTGMSVDTVRFYVRRNLLQPGIGSKGGRNPYQMFSAKDLETAEMIRLGQSLGLSLREIGEMLKEQARGEIDDVRSIEILLAQRERLAGKIRELTRLVDYLDAKVEWIRNGSSGSKPKLEL
jgi:DNA-binding transcriptional MerR regulator